MRKVCERVGTENERRDDIRWRESTITNRNNNLKHSLYYSVLSEEIKDLLLETISLII